MLFCTYESDNCEDAIEIVCKDRLHLLIIAFIYSTPSSFSLFLEDLPAWLHR